MVWTDGHRFVELFNIIVDQISRRNYFFLCPDSTTVRQNVAEDNYLQMMYESDYDELITAIQAMSPLTGWDTVRAQWIALIQNHKATIDVQCGVWTLDEWFYIYMHLSDILTSIGYSLSNLEYVRHYFPTELSFDWKVGYGIIVE